MIGETVERWNILTVERLRRETVEEVHPVQFFHPLTVLPINMFNPFNCLPIRPFYCSTVPPFTCSTAQGSTDPPFNSFSLSTVLPFHR